MLRGVEADIAEFILKDPKKFTEYSLTELSAKSSVSQGSIVNFSNKYAGGGFPALKLKIAGALPSYEAARGSQNAFSGGGVMEALIKNNEDTVAALRNTEIINSKNDLLSAAELMLSAKRIEIYGVYRSAAVAKDLCFQLLQLGFSASAVSDVLSSAVSAAMLDSRSLVIAVSSSGKTKDVIDAVKIAKENSVPVITITSNKNSPLARLSDFTLTAGVSGSAEGEAANEIRNSQLALIDALTAYLKSVIDDGKYSKIKNIISSHNVEEH
jgi:DNA-binding MurR/RpiR family transcriptional regulator